MTVPPARLGSALLPRTLFGRLVAILAVGLIATVAISSFVAFRERAEGIRRAYGDGLARRLEFAVAVLESTPAPLRAVVAARLRTPDFIVHVEPDDDRPRPLSRRAPRDVFGVDRLLRDRLGDRFAGFLPARPPQITVALLLSDGMRVRASYYPGAVPPPPRDVLANLGVLIAGAVGLAYLAVRYAMQPLQRLAAAANAFGRDLDAPPLAEHGTDEVRAAARAFNDMRERLRHQVAERTRVLAAISHDMQTPITRLRLRSEAVEEEPLRAKIAADLDLLEAMVREGLDYARSLDADEASSPIDVNALVESVVADAVEMGQDVTIDGTARSPWTGRPAALRRCVANLLENARRHGRGAARVALEDKDAMLRIRVVDDGPGVPAGEMENVFRPYYRLEASRSRAGGGSGLGLAIARNLARAQGGDVTLRNRDEGGLEAEIRLPRG